MANTENLENSNSDESILQLAIERFRLAEEAESEIRKYALEDLEFRAGMQWPDDVKTERGTDGRPCLVINRIPQFIRQITNDQRQNRPAIRVSPVDDHADLETAKIYQGLIRHIEYNSNADIAYDTAFEGAVTKSFGYYRIVTDYIDPMSFEQEILIKRIRNAFSVYLDPNSKEPDGSDANWGFIFEDVPKEEFKAEYKESKLCSPDNWRSIGDSAPGWANDSTCRVAEYFYKDFKSVDIVQLNNGQTLQKSKISKILPDGIKIVAERKSVIPVIKWCKITGLEILSKTDWPGRWVPIVPVIGDELDVNGRRILEGIVRHAKDSQRMYNYWASTETETIALAPRAPYIVAEGSIPKEYESQWKSANRKNHAFLPYKTVSVNGQMAPPPQRNIFEPPVQAITNARMQAADDLKSTTGIYDSALGARSNENSGVAIQRRNMQSQTSNFHFIDNFTRSLRHTGRIIVDLIPKIYDSARVIRILGENDEQEIVRINQEFEKDGKARLINLGVGKYDVTVETGPNYATKRQEALASMLDLTKAYPQVAQVAGDLMVKNMDWPGAQEIAERLKKTLPPGIAEEKDKKEQNPVPLEARQQIEQMSQLIDQLTEKLNESTDVIKTKKMELESRERIENAKNETNLVIQEMKLKGDAANAVFVAELESIKSRLGLLDNYAPINDEFNEFGFNESVPNQDVIQEEQQPTDGFPSGQPMGV